MQDGFAKKLLFGVIGLIGILTAVLFILGFTVLIYGGAWAFIKHYFGIVGAIDTPIATAIITASGAIFVSVISVLIAKSIENRKLIEKEIRDKKIPVYEEFFTFFFLFMAKKTEQTMEDFLVSFSAKFVVWGSDEVLKHWDNFKTSASQGQDQIQVLKAFEGLILTIRKDIGHNNTDLKEGILLRMLIKDYDEIKAKK